MMGDHRHREPPPRSAAHIGYNEKKFLGALHRWGGKATPSDLTGDATEAEKRSRQTCKSLGLVVRDGNYWVLTDEGKAAIAAKHPAPAGVMPLPSSER